MGRQVIICCRRAVAAGGGAGAGAGAAVCAPVPVPARTEPIARAGGMAGGNHYTRGAVDGGEGILCQLLQISMVYYMLRNEKANGLKYEIIPRMAFCRGSVQLASTPTLYLCHYVMVYSCPPAEPRCAYLKKLSFFKLNNIHICCTSGKTNKCIKHCFCSCSSK